VKPDRIASRDIYIFNTNSLRRTSIADYLESSIKRAICVYHVRFSHKCIQIVIFNKKCYVNSLSANNSLYCKGLLETYVSVANSGAVLGRNGEHRRTMAIKNIGRDRY
jgi:hypothetical protein